MLAFAHNAGFLMKLAWAVQWKMDAICQYIGFHSIHRIPDFYFPVNFDTMSLFARFLCRWRLFTKRAHGTIAKGYAAGCSGEGYLSLFDDLPKL